MRERKECNGDEVDRLWETFSMILSKRGLKTEEYRSEFKKEWEIFMIQLGEEAQRVTEFLASEVICFEPFDMLLLDLCHMSRHFYALLQRAPDPELRKATDQTYNAIIREVVGLQNRFKAWSEEEIRKHGEKE